VDGLKSDVILTAEEDYLSAKSQFDRAEEQLRKVDEAFREASERETAAQSNFKKVMQETFGRVSSRFQGYLSRFGWTGYLNVEPVQGTQFDLQIYLSVYADIEPRPLLRNRSGGETSTVAALLTLAMVKEYRRPFYIFDEIDQSLDPANVLKLGAILRQELDRKYIIISHRLNKSQLEQGQFGIGVYRSQTDGSRTRIYRRKDGPDAS
jgi:chromosome segregation ATPase